MPTVPIHDAKTHLSRLVDRACAGEDIVIAKGKSPKVRLVPVEDVAKNRGYGMLAGTTPRIPDDFFAPVTEAELADWEQP